MDAKDFDYTAILHVPRQTPAPEPVSDSMRALTASYPPLGQATQVERGSHARFTVLLEVHESRARDPWQVALWYSSSSGGQAQEWTETFLTPISPQERPCTLQDVDASSARSFHTVQLPVLSSVSFTIKFRPGPQEPWRWIRDEQGFSDGTLVVNSGPDSGLSEDLGDIIQDLNPSLSVRSLMSQTPGTQLWSVKTTVQGAKGDISNFTETELGLPWGGFLRWFAVVRIWAPWIAPRHGRSHFELDRDAILCSFLSPEGKHLVLLAMSGMNDIMTIFRSTSSGRVLIRARNDGSKAETATVLAATGDNFESANATVMYHARGLVTAYQATSNKLLPEIEELIKDVKAEWVENWYDGLGYCTWNGIGQRLTDEKILQAVGVLAKSNINITSLIIDDNWQDIDYEGEGQFQYRWKGFEAEPKAFPKGLKDTVMKIRAAHPSIQHIAVWHAILGYWGGISPDGAIAKSYKTIEVVRETSERRELPLGGKMTVVAKDDVHKFYDDFYRFLASCGVDAVKTDAQFMMDMWISATVRRELITTYLDAWNIASLRHFSIKAISCMSQSPNIMFYSQLPHNRPPMLCRNSDDFFPAVPASHPWHVWANAHNSLLTQHLNILPDWDMFQTVHDFSGFHAAARCVSGGPIYITDVPGHHNVDLIKQMTGETTRGKTVILRPSNVGKTIDPYVGYHDDSLLKIGTYHGAAETGSPILGIFNVSSRPLTDIIPLSRFPGATSSKHYVVRAYSTGRVTPPMQTGSASSLLTTTLDIRGYEILSAFPLYHFENKAGAGGQFGNLGLVGKMTGAAAIVASHFSLLETGNRVLLVTRLKALGVLGVYVSALPNMSAKEDFFATIQEQPLPSHTARVSKQDSHVLELDIETAWRELGLSSGWSNEVAVKVYTNIG